MWAPGRPSITSSTSKPPPRRSRCPRTPNRSVERNRQGAPGLDFETWECARDLSCRKTAAHHAHARIRVHNPVAHGTLFLAVQTHGIEILGRAVRANAPGFKCVEGLLALPDHVG